MKFKRIGNSRLFIPEFDFETPTQARIAFLFKTDDGARNEISLIQSWGLGRYALLEDLPEGAGVDWTKLGGFIHDEFRRKEGQVADKDPRFGVFDSDGKNRAGQWILVAPNGGGGNSVTVAQTAYLNIGHKDFELKISHGALVNIRRSTIEFEALGENGHALRYWSQQAGDHWWKVDGALRLHFGSPPQVGTFSFDCTLTQDHIDAFGCEQRFFETQKWDPTFGGTVTAARFPLFSSDKNFVKAHRMHARIDPLRPYDHERSFFAFADAGALGETNPNFALMSNFETARGHRVALIPTSQSGFVLSQGATGAVVDVGQLRLNGTYSYLTPDGPFELLVQASDDKASDGSTEAHLLLTGLSRTEYIEFTSRQAVAPGHVIEFFADKPALDRRTAREQVPLPAEKILTEELTTPWIRVHKNGNAANASRQPDQMALYRNMSADPKILNFAPSTVDHSRPLPAVPLLGINKTSNKMKAQALRAERTVLSEQRGWCLPYIKTELLEPLTQATDRGWHRTPQGFCVKRDASGRWTEILIAQLPGTDNTVSLSNLDDDFADALTRNRVFAVLDSNAHISDPKKSLFDITAKFSIANWGLTLSLGQGSDTESVAVPQTVLIAKSYDKSIEELLTEPELWSNKKLIERVDADRLVATLGKMIEDAKTRRDEDRLLFPGVRSRYENFITAMTDPDWVGFLLVNLHIDGQNLPTQIKGLLGGIELDKFLVHHVGAAFVRNQIDNIDNGVLAPTGGGIFGLIDYRNEETDSEKKALMAQPHVEKVATAYDPDRDFSYKVERLSVLFEGSQIARFDCRINLRLGTLFSEKIEPERGASTNGRELRFDGQYESRIVDGVRQDTYSFIHTNDYELKLDSFIFESIVLQKLQFSTVDVDGDKVRARVALWGRVDFQNISPTIDFPGIEAAEFDDLGITFDFSISTPDISIPGFDLGSVRFVLPDWGRGDGFLSKLPFKLKFFEYAPSGSFNLGDRGYFGLSLDGALPDFRFGLGFDLDVGSLGALASDLKGIRLTTLFGWLPKISNSDRKAKFGIGVRFEGGKGGALDIGLQGVLRLTAEEYDFHKIQEASKKYFMVELKQANLYILGYKLPANGTFSLFLFLDPEQPKFNKIGWFMGVEDPIDTDALKVSYLGMGQRIDANPDLPPDSTHDAVQKLVDLGKVQTTQAIKDTLRAQNNARLKYDPERDWTVGLRAEIYDLCIFEGVFMDPDMYGARLRVPAGSDDALFDVDILYRKIDEGLGVYSTELVLPEYLRQLEFGAASITIPSIALDIWTDGGFSLDLGYPGEGLDFSRSFTVQVVPFLGSGGVVYSRIDGLGAQTFPQPKQKLTRYWKYDPVTRVAFAARVGLGKEIRKGIFQAGISISLFGMVDGTWGRLRALETAPGTLTVPPKTYVVVAGRFGVLGEIFGYVDFGIIRAGVSIRIWASVGLVLETWLPTLLYFEAGVTARATVVIARIKIFGKKIEIRASFSFSTTIRYDWTVGSRDARYDHVFDQGAAGQALFKQEKRQNALLPFSESDDVHKPISWTAEEVFATKPDVNVWFAPDVTLDDEGEPNLVLLMLCPGGPEGLGEVGTRPFDHVIEAVLLWAIRCRLQADEGFDPNLPVHDWKLSAEDVSKLEKSLAQPIRLSRQSNGETPLNYAALRAFLGKNLNITISTHPDEDDWTEDKKEAGAAFFPVPKELVLKVTRAGQEDNPIRLSELRKISNDYQDQLDAFFDKALSQMNAKAPQPLETAAAADDPTALEVVFEDYFALLIKSGVNELKQAYLRLVDSGDEALPVSELLKALREPDSENSVGRPDPSACAFNRIAASAGRFQLYGLRVPAPQDGTSMPFYALTELERRLSEEPWAEAGPAIDDGYEVRVEPDENAPGSAWFSTDVEDSVLNRDAIDAMRTAQSQLDPQWEKAPELSSVLRAREKRYGFADPVQIDPDDKSNRGYMWPLNEMLQADLRARKAPLELTIGKGNAEQDDAEEQGLENWQWVTCIPLQISRVTRFEIGQNPSADGGESQVVAEPPSAPEPSTGYVSHVYSIGGTNEANRRLLDRLVRNEKAADFSIELLYEQAEPALNAGVKSGKMRRYAMREQQSFVFKSNLSTIERPHGESGIEALNSAHNDSVFSANFSKNDSNKLLELVRQGSVVNSGGYYLYLDPRSDNPDFDDLFDENSGQATLTLRIVFGQPTQSGQESLPPARDYFTGIHIHDRHDDLSDIADSRSKKYLFAQSGEQQFEPAMDPGHVPISIIRARPERRFKKGTSGKRGTINEIIEPAVLDSLPGEVRKSMLIEVGEVEVELEERFNLLEWHLQDRPDSSFAELSGDKVLPIGPCELGEDVTQLKSYGDPKHEWQGEDWLYEQIIPAFKLAKKDEALGEKQNATPEQDANIYAGVGKDLVLDINFRDVYGNRLRPSHGDETYTVKVLYFDRLIHPFELDGVTAIYDWGHKDSNTIRAISKFKVDKFKAATDGGDEEWYDPNSSDSGHIAAGKRIASALTSAERVVRQLSDKNVCLYLQTPLADGGEIELDAEKEKLIDHCKRIKNALDTMYQGIGQGPVPTVADFKLNAVIPLLSQVSCAELTVAMEVRRPSELVTTIPGRAPAIYQPAFKANFVLQSAVGEIAQGVSSSQLRTFDDRFQKAFGVGAESDFVLATGVGANKSKALWVINRKMFSVTLDWDAMEEINQPAAFAPPPLSPDLMSGEFGGGIVARDVDLDDYMHLFVKDLERFLSPEISGPARKLDLSQTCTSVDPVDQVLNCKKLIAGKYSDILKSVFKKERPFVEKALEAARPIFKDRLLNDLAGAYDVDTVLAYPIKTQADVGAYKFGLYGQVVLADRNPAEGEDNPEPQFSFYPVSIDFGAEHPHVVVLFDSGGANSSSWKIEPRLKITHIKWKLGNTDYRPSAWLKLVQDREVNLFNNKPIDVPIVLRRYPTPPVLIDQRAASCNKPTTLAEARQWRFEFDFGWQDVDQDTILVDVEYNDQTGAEARPRAADVADWRQELLGELASYRKLRDHMWQELNNLPQLDTARTVESSVGEAVCDFSEAAHSIASVFEKERTSTQRTDKRMVDRFILDESGNSEHRNRTIKVTSRMNGATWQAKVLKVQPLDRNGSPVSTTPAEIELSGFVKDPKCLTYDLGSIEEGDWLRRRVTLSGLDIVSNQSAWASIRLQRNKTLGEQDGRKTDDAFLYSTDPVRFGERLTPALECKTALETGPTERSLKDHLVDLLNEAVGVANVKMTVVTAVSFDIGWGYDNEWLALTRAPHPGQRMIGADIRIDDQFTGIDKIADLTAEGIKAGILALPLPPDLATGRPRGALVFDLTLYASVSSSDGGQPILHLKNVRLPLSKIKF